MSHHIWQRRVEGVLYKVGGLSARPRLRFFFWVIMAYVPLAFGLTPFALAYDELSDTPNQSIGFYTRGRLAHPAALSAEGEGFVHLFPQRQRQYGSGMLVATLVESAAELLRRYPAGERIQIGDLSDRHGGMISRHGSHQNGLDADIVYLRRNLREQQPQEFDGFMEFFVQQSIVSANFDLERNWELVRILVATGRVNRILVDPLIKAAFCDFVAAQARSSEIYEEDRDALHHLQPYPLHNDHMHLRLRCPRQSSGCVEQSQSPLPPGPGCPLMPSSDSIHSV